MDYSENNSFMDARLLDSLGVALAILLAGASALPAATPALPLEQQAGQFLGTTLAGLTRPDELDFWLRDRGIGLIVLYRDDFLPEGNRRVPEIVARHARPGLEPLLAVDQEGGIVVRHDAAALPSAMALGAAGSEDLARRAGKFVGCALRARGVDLNFAPVLDLSSPLDSGLGTRSFGRDPGAVSRLGAAFIEGAAAAGLLSIAKHFPGQGFADADPHFGPSKSSRSTAEMRSEDLLPFRRAIAAGAAGVMTAHVSYPAWQEAGDAPASISAPLLGTVLREDLGFEGLVITDAIQMRGLGESLDAGELAVRAIAAGADIVLAPAPLERDGVYRAVLAAIRSGRLSPERVQRTLDRVRAARALAARNRGSCPQMATVADEIARAAVTRIGSASLLDSAASFFIGSAGEIADRFPPERRHLLPIDPPRGREAIEARVAEITACGPSRWVALIQNRSQAELVASLTKQIPGLALTVIVAGSPYDAAGIEADEFLFTYGSRAGAMDAVIDVLEGRKAAPGRLPVDVDGIGGIGEGETTTCPDIAVEAPEPVGEGVSSGARESP